ncbi:MAG: hypothetical protein K2O85_07480 [Helicobacter sp.]|nr:hypothetical protein [Helicobacter sp.]
MANVKSFQLSLRGKAEAINRVWLLRIIEIRCSLIATLAPLARNIHSAQRLCYAFWLEHRRCALWLGD